MPIREPFPPPFQIAGRAAVPAPTGDDVIDAAALATLRSLDPTGVNKLLDRVLAAFETSTARLLPQLRQARAQADAQTVKQVAHTLRSSSASLGAMKLSRLCAEIETMIRDGQPFSLLDSRAAALEVEVAVALGALRKLLRSGP